MVLLRSALTPSYDLLPSFVSNIYVVHFFRISSTLLTCPVELQEFILAHMDSQTRFLPLFVVVDERLEKDFQLISAGFGVQSLSFLVLDAMTHSKYCRLGYMYVD